MGDRLAAKWGLILSERFGDGGLSAFSGRNRKVGALGRIVEQVKAGLWPRGTKLMLEAVDRLTRENGYDAEARVRELLDLGIIIVVASGEYVYSADRFRDPYDGTMAATQLKLLLDMAHRESLQKSDRVKSARQKERKAIMKAATTGQHHVVSKICPGWFMADREANRYIPIPPRVETLNMMFRLAVNENLGRQAIARRLNEAGREPFTRSGQGLTLNPDKKCHEAKSWSELMVRNLLGDQRVIGYVIPHERNVTTGGKRKPVGEAVKAYPSVVDEELFYAAQQSRAIRRRGNNNFDKRPLSTRIANLYAGIAVCGKCGSGAEQHRYGVGSRQVEKETRLICSACRRSATRDGVRVCVGAKSHPYKAIETYGVLLLRMVIDHLSGPEFIASQSAEIRSLRIEKGRIEREKKNNDDAISVFDANRVLRTNRVYVECLTLMDKLEGELAAVNTKLQNAETDSARRDAVIASISSLIFDAWNDVPEAREQIRELFAQHYRVIVDDEHTRIVIDSNEWRVERQTGDLWWKVNGEWEIMHKATATEPQKIARNPNESVLKHLVELNKRFAQMPAKLEKIMRDSFE